MRKFFYLVALAAICVGCNQPGCAPRSCKEPRPGVIECTGGGAGHVVIVTTCGVSEVAAEK